MSLGHNFDRKRLREDSDYDRKLKILRKTDYDWGREYRLCYIGKETLRDRHIETVQREALGLELDVDSIIEYIRKNVKSKIEHLELEQLNMLSSILEKLYIDLLPIEELTLEERNMISLQNDEIDTIVQQYKQYNTQNTRTEAVLDVQNDQFNLVELDQVDAPAEITLPNSERVFNSYGDFIRHVCQNAFTIHAEARDYVLGRIQDIQSVTLSPRPCSSRDLD